MPFTITIFLLAVQLLGEARGAEQAGVETLVAGTTLERDLAVGEVHSFGLNLAADQTASLQLEKRGVAAVVVLFSPAGETLGTYGSTALSRGTERISFLSEDAGEYRLTVRTFFKPSPPGRYLLTLTGVAAATDQDKIARASQSCQQADWFDREDNFLVDEALEGIFVCLSAVAGRLEADFPQAAPLTASAETEVQYLKESWHWGEFVSPAYQENLVQSFTVLASAVREPDPETAFATLNAVVEDLRVKADHCRKSIRGLGADVTVKVQTKNKLREDPGWVVYYKLGIFEFAQQRKPNRFTELSSPSIGTLPAGRYLIWAWKPGLPESEPARKELFRIGEGAKELTLDLMVQ